LLLLHDCELNKDKNQLNSITEALRNDILFRFTYDFGDYQRASIAQWLEHWSCKPGVASSILAGGKFFFQNLNKFKFFSNL
jgi:hypothetical protein